MSDIKRGEIYYADLEPVVGSEQGGLRPVLILQNNIGNKYSPTVIVAAIKNRTPNKKLPTHVGIAIPTLPLVRFYWSSFAPSTSNASVTPLAASTPLK